MFKFIRSLFGGEGEGGCACGRRGGEGEGRCGCGRQGGEGEGGCCGSC